MLILVVDRVLKETVAEVSPAVKETVAETSPAVGVAVASDNDKQDQIENKSFPLKQNNFFIVLNSKARNANK